MVFIFLAALITIVSLVTLHELGHFILAKKFGVKVEEFGIGYPPRIFGKKVGETVYSLNLLPFGAFVRLYGESEKIKDSRSFSGKPFWQKSLIILGGVISFWVVAFILFTIVMILGVPTVIGDNDNYPNSKIQIMAVIPDSPAGKAGIRIGDIILKIKDPQTGIEKEIDKTKELQEFIKENKGKEVILTIQRGKEFLSFSLVPRISPPEGQGPIGVALVRTALKKYPWYLAPFEGAKTTVYLTGMVLKGWASALINLIQRKPAGVELVGPVGVFGLFIQAGELGLVYFLQFVAIISIFVALTNVVPIPITDGGKFLLLTIEKIRGKEISSKVEQRINAFFFALLIALMIWVTIKDISKFF